MEQITLILTSRFEDALVFATQLHARQTRKGSGIPYIAHLLSVTALVLEAGGNEDAAIAALLHDAVEDQGGLETLKEIRHRFGDNVANIVDSCTDAYTIPKPPWRKRKEDYIAHLREASAQAQLVSLADKLHNARSILRDLNANGDITWSKFNGGKDGTLWYYRTLLQVFKEIGYLFKKQGQISCDRYLFCTSLMADRVAGGHGQETGQSSEDTGQSGHETGPSYPEIGMNYLIDELERVVTEIERKNRQILYD